MNQSAVHQSYKESAVLTATPERLVVMLYDGAHRFLFQAPFPSLGQFACFQTHVLLNDSAQKAFEYKDQCASIFAPELDQVLCPRNIGFVLAKLS